MCSSDLIVDSIQKTTKSGEKGAVIYQHTPEILNRVDFTNAQLKVVKQGMYDAVNGNDPFMTASALRGMAQKVAAKTGTAQSFYYDQNNPDNTNPPATIPIHLSVMHRPMILKLWSLL